MRFQRERWQDIWSEFLPLAERHWHEIAHYKDIALDVAYDWYCQAEDTGLLRCYTARSDDVMVGYINYFVRTNPHYQQSLQAMEDVLFLAPEYRGGGLGKEFILYTEQELRKEGVQVVGQHIKAAHNFGSLLEKVGYELVDLVYLKRLDKEA